MHNILVKPIFTEKVTYMQSDEKHKKYGFIVDVYANKIEIAKAVEKKFKVEVVSVNTVRYEGKIKTQFRKSGRFSGKTPRFKKAYVLLKEGQSIEFFENA